MNVSASPAPLLGLHHLTAVTGDAAANFAFYTRVLGMRLVKKTVNQDDVSAYHLFYGDELGSPGTELTFFDWPSIAPTIPGAGAISETALRVRGGRAALEWWANRLRENGATVDAIATDSSLGNGVWTLAFRDPEGQSLRLIADERPGADEKEASRHWASSPVPAERGVVRLSGVTLTVRQPEQTARVLTETLGFRQDATDPQLFHVGEGARAGTVRLIGSTAHGRGGVGGVHHVAFAVADPEEQRAWREKLVSAGLAVSDMIDRFYFGSIYFRVPGGILFEIATDGPGFTADGEDANHLGERLSLPPMLEKHRAQIEAGLQPLDSTPDALTPRPSDA